MGRRWFLLIGVAVLFLVPAAPAQSAGFRGGLMGFPSVVFAPPYGLPVSSPYYPYVPGLSPYGMNPVIPGQPRLDSLQMLLQDYRRTTRPSPGRPQQKIEEFDPPAKNLRPAADAPTKATPGKVEVKVPDGAEVWFDGVKSSETGSVRQFESPPIEPGETRACKVRARWKGAAQDTDEIRHVTLRPGQRLTVDLMPRVGAGTPPLSISDKR